MVDQMFLLICFQSAMHAITPYLVYRGKLAEGSSWESVIADDFATIRKASITHPRMAGIENELGLSRR